ncbi:MAG: ribonuclease Y [Candidatus Omnitrophica bacterium]|nr:ribonuclease Y [Candidatus Omnitrophota bacterium]
MFQQTLNPVVIGGIGVAIGLCIGMAIRHFFAAGRLKSARIEAKTVLEQARLEAENKRREVELEAKDLMYKLRHDFEKETKERRDELQALEKRLVQKEENLDRKVDVLEKKEHDVREKETFLSTKEEKLQHQEQELEQQLNEEKRMLQKISGLSIEEAKKLLLSKMENDVRHEADLMVKRIEEETQQRAEKKAKEIISLAMQRCAAEHTIESTISVVSLPNDEMKGRIIGREGRNIRAFEEAAGVDVIIDDTPGAVTLSSFDTVRREVARIALERLIVDGRIHPARIEEIVEKVKKEIEVEIQEEGEKTVLEFNLHRVHPELVRLLGRLKYRTSYGQNVLGHAKEVAYLMGVMASELGLNPQIAKRCGLLHDIGKAVSHEAEGPHAKIGAELAKKYGEHPEVIHCIEAHHEDVEQHSIYAVLSQVADAISGSRPGARRETLEHYIKRLTKLEKIADSFKGVEKSFAIQAGREIRVIVKPDQIGDGSMSLLARDITKKIEESLEYPGQIKVILIREMRTVEYAK